VKPLRCAVCGKQHDDVPPAIAFRRPLHYFRIPEAERETRVRDGDDLCIVDNEEFLLRGVVEVPNVGGGAPFEWGLWALVSRDDFERVYAKWDEDCTAEPPFPGALSAEPPGYDGLFMVPVSVRLRTASERPIFFLDPRSSHRLAQEQRNGITPADWHAIARSVMPWLFGLA
jgi:hypothetical protein